MQYSCGTVYPLFRFEGVLPGVELGENIYWRKNSKAKARYDDNVGVGILGQVHVSPLGSMLGL